MNSQHHRQPAAARGGALMRAPLARLVNRPEPERQGAHRWGKNIGHTERGQKDQKVLVQDIEDAWE